MHIRYSVLLAPFLLMSLLTGSLQAQTVFTRTYEAAFQGRNIEIHNRELLVAGNMHTNLGLDFGFMKLDTMGVPLDAFSYRYRGRNRLEFIRPHPDGGYVVAGSSEFNAQHPDSSEIVIIRISPNGFPTWAKAYKTQANRGGYLSGLDVGPDGKIAFAAHMFVPATNVTQRANAGVVVALDSVGNMLWHKVAPLSNASMLTDVARVRSNLSIFPNGRILTGWNYAIRDNSGHVQRGFDLRMYNAAGTVVRHKQFKVGHVLAMSRTPNDNGVVFYFVDRQLHNAVAKLDSTSNQVWAFKDAYGSNNIRPTSLKAVNSQVMFMNDNRITRHRNLAPGAFMDGLAGTVNALRMTDFAFRGNQVFILSHTPTASSLHPAVTRAVVDTVANCYVEHFFTNNYAAFVVPKDTMPVIAMPVVSLQDTSINLVVSLASRRSHIRCVGQGLVWPGDANSDGVANVRDLLFVGLAWNQNGPARVNPTTNWVGQFALNWPHYFFNGANHKHADANGNGHVGIADLLAILMNYGMTHNKGNNGGTADDPPLYIEMPVDSIETGQSIQVPVFLGTADKPVTGLYGLSFDVAYNTTLIDTNSMTFTPLASSWLGIDSTDLIAMDRDIAFEGQLEVALTRTNLQEVSGYGMIGMLTFVTIENIAGKDLIAEKLMIELIPTSAINTSEDEIPLFGGQDSVILFQDESTSTSITNPEISAEVVVFPNPTQGLIQISSSSIRTESVEIMDHLGRTLWIEEVGALEAEIDLRSLSPAFYILKGQSTEGYWVRRILIE